ncbi:MAG: sigma-70 family RNA polymerase sigma factor [Phycisphaerae bacterium]|nr:sigma-70 family RNA polymerase sigma factor [Phycisphaerae bacterium]
MKPIRDLIDQVLVLRCQTRDPQALAELIDRYQGPLRYFIARMVRDDDLADELCQETWLTVLSKIHTLREVGTFTTWLYRIARNRVYLEFRRRRQVFDLDDGLEIPDAVEEEIKTVEDAAELHRCLERLKPLHSEVLLLRFLEDMSYEQIADALECNLGTVRSRIFHAKLALKKELEKSYDNR